MKESKTRGARNSVQGANKVDDDVPLVEHVDEDVQARKSTNEALLSLDGRAALLC